MIVPLKTDGRAILFLMALLKAYSVIRLSIDKSWKTIRAKAIKANSTEGEDSCPIIQVLLPKLDMKLSQLIYYIYYITVRLPQFIHRKPP